MGVYSRLRTQAGQLHQEVADAAKSKTVPRSLGPLLDMLLSVLGPALLDWLKQWLEARTKDAKVQKTDKQLTETALTGAGRPTQPKAAAATPKAEEAPAEPKATE